MRGLTVFLILLGIAAGGAGGYWLGHRGSAGKAEEGGGEGNKSEEQPVPTVRVAPIEHRSLSRKIVAYGTVAAPPGEVRVISVPFECRVVRLLVTPGQAAYAGQALVEVAGSPATELAFSEAKTAASAADRDLQLVKQRYEQKLATNSELFAAENAQKLAQGRLQNLQQAGANGPRQLKSDSAGIVSKVDVQIGQVVPIGGPLVEIAAGSRIEVKLGAEPNDVRFLKEGEPVKLRAVDRSPSDEVVGKIRVLGQRVDATTRLVDVTVELPADAKFLLDQFVAGELSAEPADGLFVPRDAALPDDQDHYTLFTVKDGVAVKHAVRIGIEADGMVQVIGEGLKEGDAAVVVGNFELKDGMKVEAQPATKRAEEPSTEPGDKPVATTSRGADELTSGQPGKALSTTGPALSAEGRK